MSRLRFRSLGGEGDALELDFHRAALVDLKGDDAFFRCLGGVVSDVGGELAVDEMLHVVALGDDFVIVPVVLIDCGLDFFAVAGRASDFDLGLGGLPCLARWRLFGRVLQGYRVLFPRRGCRCSCRRIRRTRTGGNLPSQ